jgi:MFS family permease
VLFAAGLAGMAFFVWWEARARSAVFPVHLLRHNRVFALSSLTALISYSSVWAMTFLMSLYLQFIKGLNPDTAGLVLVAGVALQCLISPFGGRLSDRIEPRWVASGGMALCTIGLLLFSFLRADTPYWYIVLALCFLGLGYAFFAGPNQNSIMGSVERRYAGFASASISTVRMVGMAISTAGATLIMALVVGRHDIQPTDYPNVLRAVRLTFAIFTGICALSVLASLVRGRMPEHAPPPEETEAETP